MLAESLDFRVIPKNPQPCKNSSKDIGNASIHGSYDMKVEIANPSPDGYVIFASVLLLFSHPVMPDSFDCSLPGKNTEVGCHSPGNLPDSRDQTHVSCISRQVLYHWATRKALSLIMKPHFPQLRNSSNSPPYFLEFLEDSWDATWEIFCEPLMCWINVPPFCFSKIPVDLILDLRVSPHSAPAITFFQYSPISSAPKFWLNEETHT